MLGITNLVSKIFLFAIIFLINWTSADNLADYYGFAGMEIYKIEGNSFNMCVGDFNGDGWQDIAVVNNSMARVEFLYNIGGRSSSGQTKDEQIDMEGNVNLIRDDASYIRDYYPLDFEVISFAVGDVTGDQKTDMVFVSDDKKLCIVPQKVCILPHKTEGWHDKKYIELKTAPNLHNSLKICDFNRDGANDILILCPDHTLLFYQRASGEFPRDPYVLANLSKNPGDVLIGDFNGDGLPDLLTFYPDRQEPLTYRWQNQQSFFSFEIALSIPPVRFVDVYDGNGDGIAEIYTIQKSTGRLKVYTLSKEEASTSKTSAEFQLFAMDPAKAGDHRASTIGDMNGDGRPDIIVTEPSTAQITFYRQLKNGIIGAPEYFPCWENTNEVFYLGRQRLAVSSSTEQIMGIISFDKNRFVFPHPLVTKGKLLCMDVKDINRDDILDIAYVAEDQSETSIYFLFQHPSGEFSEKAALKLEKLDTAPNKIKMIDLNQDTLIDVILLLPYVGAKIYLQQVEGDFVALQSQKDLALFKELSFHQIGEGDVDGDGKNEVLVAKNNYVRALVVTKDGNFRTVDQYNCEQPNAHISAAMMVDIDGDGKKEMAVLEQTSKALIFFTQDEKSLYRESLRYPIIDFDLRNWLSLDVNSDGSSDILIAGAEKFGIFYFHQVPLQLREKYSYESEIPKVDYKNLVVGDINNDRVSDIVVVENQHHLLEILTWNSSQEIVHALQFRVFEPASMRSSERPSQSSGGGVREVLIGDVNRDGKNDLLLLVHDRILIYSQD